MKPSIWGYIKPLICAAVFLGGGFRAVSAAPDLKSETSYAEALKAFNAGNFEQALQLVTDGMKQESLPPETRAMKHVMAAEILSARVMLGQVNNPKNTAKQAREHAKIAVELAPNYQYAQLQYTVADGLVTRLTSPFKVWRKKLSSKTLANINNYKTTYPKDPRD